MSEPTNTTSPFVIAASIAVIIASAVGVASFMGLLPSQATKPEPAAITAAPAPVEPEVKTEASTPPANTSDKATVEKKPVAKHTEYATRTEHKPARKAVAKAPVAQDFGYAPRNEPVAAAPVCASCGTISSIRAVEQAGEGSGLGAIAGGVIGGILGHQVGGGTGKDLATIAGAVGGGYAGHQIEKKTKTTKRYEISVRMDNGGNRSFEQDIEPAFVIGDKVKVIDGALVRN